jgi:hypothetical protein
MGCAAQDEVDDTAKSAAGRASTGPRRPGLRRNAARAKAVRAKAARAKAVPAKAAQLRWSSRADLPRNVAIVHAFCKE